MGQVLRHLRVDGSRPVRHGVVLRDARVHGTVPPRRPEQLEVLRPRRPCLGEAPCADRGVDHLLGHLPVCGPLPARDRDKPVRPDGHDVVAADARCVILVGVRVRRQRPDAGPSRQHIRLPNLDVQEVLDLVQDEVDLLLRRPRAHREGGLGVSGAGHGVLQPRQHEQHAAVPRPRDDDPVGLPRVVVGQHHVDARRRRDHLGGGGVRHRSHAIHKRPRRVDDDLGVDVHAPPRLEVPHGGADDSPGRILEEPLHLGVVCDGGAARRSGAREGHVEAGVVELPVVVHDHALERFPFGSARREGRESPQRVAGGGEL
mmetsp:Transcript_1276/g.3054  ORF Transcript_1276/g.3054 Transcript_1276/m.3054 type:complete len:316 (+) Transcript_1276:574-1521(+)